MGPAHLQVESRISPRLQISRNLAGTRACHVHHDWDNIINILCSRGRQSQRSHLESFRRRKLEPAGLPIALLVLFRSPSPIRVAVAVFICYQLGMALFRSPCGMAGDLFKPQERSKANWRDQPDGWGSGRSFLCTRRDDLQLLR